MTILNFDPPPQLIGLLVAIIPMVIAAAFWVRFPPNRAAQGRIALATVWNAVFLLALNGLAVKAGWWEFNPIGPTIVGVPVVAWFGWTLLWGTAAAQSRVRPSVTIAILAVLDLVYMPLLSGLVTLGPSWLIGEAVLLAAVAWPALLLTSWSEQGEHLRGQAVLQFSMFAVILVWAIPALAVAAAGSSLDLDVSPFAYGAVAGGLGVAALPGLIAVTDFYLNRGTPWPWDTTDRPVRAGAYRYFRSPMQASAVAVLVVMSAVYHQLPVLVAAGTALMYSGLFSWMEGNDLEERFGAQWTQLANSENRWWPTWHPSEYSEAAIVWIDLDCDVCAPVAAFLASRSPALLDIRPANEHNQVLTRTRYERADDASFQGVAAFGACLEHINLAWAMLGWLLRLPLATGVFSMITDGVGLGQRSTTSRT